MKRVVHALNPKLDGFEASCFDGHYITGDITSSDFDAMEAQRRAQPDEEELSRPWAPVVARSAISSTHEKRNQTTATRICVPPADVRLDTLAVREGLPPSQWGENSEAMFCQQRLCAPQRRHGCSALCQ